MESHACIYHIVLVKTFRSMNMKEVLSYSLGPVPWSLATAEGAMTKTAKSNPLPILKVQFLLLNNRHLMALMQSTLSMAWLCCKHFGDRLEHLENLQSSSFPRLLLDSMQQAESTLFFDRYRDSSIKNFERSRRAGPRADVLRLAVAGSSTKCPKQWSKALHVSSNVTAVVTFLVDE